MKNIYLLLMHTKTIPSKIVKIFTRYEYSHVGISLDENCDTIYSFGRRKLNSILDGGFSIENRDGPFFKKFNKTTCRIFEKEVTDKQYENLKNIIDDMKENIDDYSYDFVGIIPRLFGIPVVFKNKYVCSYFVAELLEKAGIYKFNKNLSLTKPKDFEKLEGFKEIYKGSYNLYKKNS